MSTNIFDKNYVILKNMRVRKTISSKKFILNRSAWVNLLTFFSTPKSVLKVNQHKHNDNCTSNTKY